VGGNRAAFFVAILVCLSSLKASNNVEYWRILSLAQGSPPTTFNPLPTGLSSQPATTPTSWTTNTSVFKERTNTTNTFSVYRLVIGSNFVWWVSWFNNNNNMTWFGLPSNADYINIDREDSDSSDAPWKIFDSFGTEKVFASVGAFGVGPNRHLKIQLTSANNLTITKKNVNGTSNNINTSTGEFSSGNEPDTTLLLSTSVPFTPTWLFNLTYTQIKYINLNTTTLAELVTALGKSFLHFSFTTQTINSNQVNTTNFTASTLTTELSTTLLHLPLGSYTVPISGNLGDFINSIALKFLYFNYSLL
jgi:hypothetical protein